MRCINSWFTLLYELYSNCEHIFAAHDEIFNEIPNNSQRLGSGSSMEAA